MDPERIALGLGPNGDWPRWVCGEHPLTPASHAARRRSGRASPLDHDLRDVFLHGGLVIRGWWDPAGALGIRLSPAGLEVGARLGGVHLRTMGGVASLTVGGDVPETLRASAAGRPVDQIFDHPVLRGRGHIIDWSGDYEVNSVLSEDRPPWRVLFRAEPVKWRVPWVDV